jgi:hypothetical protein
MLRTILSDSFVKRSITYFVSFILIGMIFARLFEINLDFSQVLGPIVDILP